MVEIGFNEHKKIQLQILKEVADFCDSRKLTYFLAYGTLLGAVRHKGFIPWDDDIDIYVPRDDYEKLTASFNKCCQNKNLHLVSPYSASSHHPMVKIVDKRTIKIEKGIEYKSYVPGVDIDVFPLDGQPDNEAAFVKWCKKLKFIYKLHFIFNSDKKQFNIKSWIAYGIVKYVFRGKKGLLNTAKKYHQKYNYQNSVYAGSTECFFFELGDRAHKSCFEEYLMADFEGFQFKIPKGYDEVLTNFYGDYMKLPPVEERVTHHQCKVFWKNSKIR